jgi:hypothetical protein
MSTVDHNGVNQELLAADKRFRKAVINAFVEAYEAGLPANRIVEVVREVETLVIGTLCQKYIRSIGETLKEWPTK